MRNQSELRTATIEQQWPEELHRSVQAAQNYLLHIQKRDGFWWGELEGDSILESEYIFTMYFIGLADDERLNQAASYIRKTMLADGGWSIYPGGVADVSCSVKAYFALKLMGDSAEEPHMVKARNTILQLGGLDAVNSFTRIYLALFGQYPWDKCPAVPPEISLLPLWSPINLYEMSAWSRAIVVPLSVIWASRPSCSIPVKSGIMELWNTSSPAKPREAHGFWPAFFGVLDSCLRLAERRGWIPWRQKALKTCESWMLDHFKDSDGIGAIFPPVINSIIALHCIGYGSDHPVFQSQIRELQKLELPQEDGSLKLAPCHSPVWDSALAINALIESGLPQDHPALQKAAEWILTKEVKKIGDWKIKNPEGKTGGWYFEFANEFYPDTDDTFQVLTALGKVRFSDPALERARNGAIERAVAWLFSMQNKDGGWASFDLDCDSEFLIHVPFADHNAMIDPSTVDITGRGLEALSVLGFNGHHGSVQRALEFIRTEQEEDGSWFGRWGCNYIYGTWLALQGLKCTGQDMSAERVQKAAGWLRSIQNSDGGWGESPRSYEEPGEYCRCPSTPSQTAWALIGLMATGDFESDSITRGIDYLVQNQKDDGSWQDDYWTGTGFPEVFYLRYHLYATYFPLLALGLYEKNTEFEIKVVPA